MSFRKRHRILISGKSPSLEALKRTYRRAVLNGGVTQDFSANVENIREISRKLGYNILSDATFVYVPASYGEGKNFAEVQNKRNLLQWSEEFDKVAFWLLGNATVSANSTTAPDGNLTADKLVETASNTFHDTAQSITGANGVTYTFSCYLKAAERTTGSIYLSDAVAGSIHTIVNLSTGNFTVGFDGTATWQNVSGNVINKGNGWYLATITGTRNASGTQVSSQIYVNTSTAYTGTVGNGIYMWGAQTEIGAYATPYQKTVAAGDGIVDFNFTRATSATVTNKQGVIEDSCYNRLVNSATGTTQSITVAAGTYNLSFYGTGSYTLSGVGSGTLNGTGATNRVNQSFVCTAGTLTLTVSGSITNVQFSLGSLRDYLKTTNRLNVPKLDYSRSLAEPSLLIERAATNLLLNSAVGTTQNVTVTAQVYTLSFYGTGSYTLSGTSTGTLNGTGASNLVKLTFTPTAGTLTLTVSGSITNVQLEAGSNATTRIVTVGSTVTRNAETSYVDLFNNAALNKTNFTLFWEGYLYDGQPTNMSLCLSDTTTAAANTNQIGWYNLNTPFYNIANTRTNGTSNAANNSLNKFAIRYNNGTVDFYRNGVNVWASQTVAVFDYRYLVLNSGGSTFATDKISLFNRTLTNTECINLTT